MIKTLQGGMRTGAVSIPASKSFAHRILICAALSDEASTVTCDGISKDIAATMKCLSALGASFQQTDGTAIRVTPGRPDGPETRHMYCGESGSTLRFLLPISAALGADVAFHMEGLLSKRPHKELIEQLELHGVRICQEGDILKCKGQLAPGEYVIPGGVSSQFISGLLFALPLLAGESRIRIVGRMESAAYVTMTEQAIKKAGITFVREGDTYIVPGNQRYHVSAALTVERDWSNAAFFLCLGGLSEQGVLVRGMDPESSQGDRKIIDVIRGFGASVEYTNGDYLVKKGNMVPQVIDASEIPDLVPVISVFALGAVGDTKIVNAARLRFKESDRLQSTAALINALGGKAEETEDGLVIHGTGALRDGTVDPVNDHRIAMAAAVAASLCDGTVTVTDAECVQKSYPAFWDDFGSMEVM